MNVDDQRTGGENPTPGTRCPTLPEPVMLGAGRTAVCLEVVRHGRDWVLLVGGGESHAGAVAVHAQAGLDAAAGPVAELVTVPGHKEGPLAAECAAALMPLTGGTWVAVVGIHQDNATKEEITAIVANVRRGLALLTDHFTRSPEDGS
jgi:hypothetical protein